MAGRLCIPGACRPSGCGLFTIYVLISWSRWSPSEKEGTGPYGGQGYELLSTFGLPIFQVIDHCPAHIRDKRQFHGLPCFRLRVKQSFFSVQFKVFQSTGFNVRAETQAARDQDDGIVRLPFGLPRSMAPTSCFSSSWVQTGGCGSPASWLLTMGIFAAKSSCTIPSWYRKRKKARREQICCSTVL